MTLRVLVLYSWLSMMVDPNTQITLLHSNSRVWVAPLIEPRTLKPHSLINFLNKGRWSWHHLHKLVRNQVVGCTVGKHTNHNRAFLRSPGKFSSEERYHTVSGFTKPRHSTLVWRKGLLSSTIEKITHDCNTSEIPLQLKSPDKRGQRPIAITTSGTFSRVSPLAAVEWRQRHKLTVNASKCEVALYTNSLWLCET